RTVYYKPTKAEPKVQPRLVEPIKAMIEENPSFGYRTVAHLLDLNKNTVQRVFQMMGWQVRKRPVGSRPRIQALPSVATAPDERWATDMCRVWCGRDNWATLALVIDCHTRELLGWHLSRSGRSKTAESAMEQALIARYGHLGRVAKPFLLRSDNGLVFTSRSYTALVKSYGLQQEFHPLLPGAKRHGRAGDQNPQRPMCSPPPIRDPAARQPCDWGLDRLL
ncbi:MAG: hypothetical protein RI949_2135, partial [Pseudomonadota bacterium]